MPNAWNYFDYTNEFTRNYKKKINVADVQPKITAVPKFVWIIDDSIPMRILFTLVKTNSPEIVTSKIDYK